MAPLDGTHPVNNFGNFELKCSLSANNVIPVHKYVSNKTGLTVVVGEVEGPLVNGYFCLGNNYLRNQLLQINTYLNKR